MPTQQNPLIVNIIQVFAAALAGLLLPLATAVIAWLNQRSGIARRGQMLALARQRIEFLNAWEKAQEAVLAPEQIVETKRTVSQALGNLWSEITPAMEADAKKQRQSVSERPWIERAFLLFLPRSGLGWLFHSLFYMFLFVTALVLLITASDALSSQWDWVASDLLYIGLPTFLLTVLFHQLAVRADRRIDMPVVSQGSVAQTTKQA